MYPSTIFELIDNSDLDDLVVPEEDSVDRPVFTQVFVGPKGPEEWQVGIMGQKVLDLYGSSPSFSKYGQPLLQTVSLAIAGAKLNTLRLAADDAKLANILVYAEVTRNYVQKTDSAGNPLYYDAAGNQTTNASLANVQVNPTDTPFGMFASDSTDQVVDQVCEITLHATDYACGNKGRTTKEYEIIRKMVITDTSFPASESVGIVGVKYGDYANATNVDISATSAGSVYPLFMIMDNGRGSSNKSFKIYVDETARRPVDYTRYILEIYEGSDRLEQMAFTFNPDQIENGKNINIFNVITNNSTQVRCHLFEDQTKLFLEQIASVSGLTYEDICLSDILIGSSDSTSSNMYANDTYGKPISSVIISNSGGFVFNSGVGLTLMGGSDGSWAGYNYDTLIDGSTTNADTRIAENFGELGISDDIYDLDNFRVDVIFDANYPAVVKRAIEDYVNFRDDVFYFRDMGTGLSTLAEIEAADAANQASRACATYQNSWDILDPYSKKRITVTATYNLGLLFVDHWINGKSRPFCGMRYGVTLPDVIEGTVNFVPKNVPSTNQKQIIDDMRINYCSYYQGTLTLDTEYTSQTRNTQLSWLNNVLSIMWLIKQIRYRCPKIRYAYFTSSTDDTNSLETYLSDVQSVIDQCAPDFASITLSYEANNVYANNKIFYACIEVKMKNFIQSERFKITVIKSD